MNPYSAVDMLAAMNGIHLHHGDARWLHLRGRRLRTLVTLIAALTPWLVAGMLWAS